MSECRLFTSHSLVTRSRSLLVATFELLPDSTTIPSSPSYGHRSTRPVSLYGPSQPWPLPYSPPDPIADASLNGFFAHSSAGRSLKTRQEDFRDSWKNDGMAKELSRPVEPKYATFLSTRTWITLSSEYSIYGVDQYIKAQDALKEFKVSLSNGFVRGAAGRADLVNRRPAQTPGNHIPTIQIKRNVTGLSTAMGISRICSYLMIRVQQSNGSTAHSLLPG